jgi:hypothetical protein
MDDVANIDDLMDTVRGALEDAFNRGVKAGADKKTSELLAVLGVGLAAGIVAGGSSPAPSFLSAASSSADKARRAPPKMKGPRAPKGLVADALNQIFSRVEGITTKEVETQAIAIDGRINPKTVYNELWRRTTLYRQENGRWFRVVEAQPSELDRRVGDGRFF